MKVLLAALSLFAFTGLAPAKVTVSDIRRKLIPRFAGHFLIDPLEAFDEAADVVLAVAVLPNVINDLLDRSARLIQWLRGERGGVLEVVE